MSNSMTMQLERGNSIPLCLQEPNQVV